MSLDRSIIDAVVAAADKAGIPREALLAVVEVESDGGPCEQDGRTPRLLFERHVFHRMLKERRPDLLALAVSQGLALPRWSRETQYKDQGRSAGRLALLARARAVDAECANLSCSWGLGQTMGFVHKEIGFATATEMVDWMTTGGVPAQIDAMVREIRAKSLIDELMEGRYADFARIYNGPGYRANRYDTRLKAARDAWDARLGGRADPPDTDAPGTDPLAANPLVHPRNVAIPPFELRAIQQRLKDLGYTDVGEVDGRLGRKTIGALTQFQTVNGLAVDGIYGPQTRAALAAPEAKPAPVSLERMATTAADLRRQGSGTIRLADRVNLLSRGVVALGLGGLGEQTGLLDGARDMVAGANSIRPLVDSLADLMRWAADNWGLLAMAAGAAGIWYASRIVARRVAQYRADANV